MNNSYTYYYVYNLYFLEFESIFNRTIQLYVADIIILCYRCRNRKKSLLSVSVMSLIESVDGKSLLNLIIYKAQYKFKVCWLLNFYNTRKFIADSYNFYPDSKTFAKNRIWTARGLHSFKRYERNTGRNSRM